MTEEKKDSKPKRPTAKKRDIQNEKRKLINRAFKSKVKTAIRSFENQVTAKDENGAKASLSSLYSLLDKGVKRNVFKKNKASRLKAKFSNRI